MHEPSTDGIRHRDKEGRPLELLEWARLYEDFEYRNVADTQLGDVLVRTMWEGLDDGVRVACMFHTGVRRNGAWQMVWEGFWPCTAIEAEAAHELVVADICYKLPAAGPGPEATAGGTDTASG
jgi:hypothetical protein